LVSISLSSALAFADPNGTQGGSVGAKKELPRTLHQSPAGVAQIYLYWPRDDLEPGWAQSLSKSLMPDMEIYVDDKKIGAMGSGDYITAQVPTGNHVVAFRAGFFSLPITKNTIAVAGGSPKHYYRIFRIFPKDNPDAVQLLIEETSEARAVQDLKELHKR
jgi:hypothetical protein